MLLGTRTIIDEVCLSTSVNDRNCEESNSVVTTFTNLTLPCKRTYFSLSQKCSVAITLRRCVMKLRLLRILWFTLDLYVIKDVFNLKYFYKNNLHKSKYVI